MQKSENIKRYTVNELKEMRNLGEGLNNWQKFDELSEDELEKIIAEDPDEQGMIIDWDSAVVVNPVKKHQSAQHKAEA